MKLLKNNRFLLLSLVIMMLLSLILNGCTTDNGSENGGKDGDALAPVVLRLAGGSDGGTWQLLAGLISEATARSVPGSDVTVVPGSGSGNAISVSKKILR